MSIVLFLQLCALSGAEEAERKHHHHHHHRHHQTSLLKRDASVQPGADVKSEAAPALDAKVAPKDAGKLPAKTDTAAKDAAKTEADAPAKDAAKAQVEADSAAKESQDPMAKQEAKSTEVLDKIKALKESLSKAKQESGYTQDTQQYQDDSYVPSNEGGRIDIDTAMPYGELEPFGREDTAQELTESSIKESDEMVDQIERAEVAEEKRSVFRALTRLRGAAITSFDGIARSQTGNIDQYNHVHKWRRTHPLHHLADEEGDVKKWAFPDHED